MDSELLGAVIGPCALRYHEGFAPSSRAFEIHAVFHAFCDGDSAFHVSMMLYAPSRSSMAATSGFDE